MVYIVTFNPEELPVLLRRGRLIHTLPEIRDLDLAECVDRLCTSLHLTLGGDVDLIKGGDSDSHVFYPTNSVLPYTDATLVCALGELHQFKEGYHGSFSGYHFVFLTTKPSLDAK